MNNTFSQNLLLVLMFFIFSLEDIGIYSPLLKQTVQVQLTSIYIGLSLGYHGGDPLGTSFFANIGTE